MKGMKITKEGAGAIAVAFVILGVLAGGFIWSTWLILSPLWWFAAVGLGWFVAFWALAGVVTWGFVIAFFRIPRRPVDDACGRWIPHV